MALKTAVRRLFKWLPISVELAEAIEQDERADLGLPQEHPLLSPDEQVIDAEATDEPKASEEADS